MIPILDLKRQYNALSSELDKNLISVASSGHYILGPQVKAFEQEFANYIGTKHAIGVGNGTDALRIALHALGSRPNTEVITTPFTFAATAETIVQTGAKPVFVDIQEHTFNIDPGKTAQAIGPDTVGIVPVHLFGQIIDTEALDQAIGQRPIFVLEDAAQAAGATRNGKKAGQLGNAAIFSFYPTKNLSCMGDGGAITTDDPELAERIRRLRVHGSSKKYEYIEIGYNSRLDELQAGVLRVKLPHLDAWNARRAEIASIYNQELSGLVQTPAVAQGNTHVYHQYTIMTDNRDQLRQYLADNGVGTAVHYPKPLHLQPAFSFLGYKKGDFPVAERVSERVLSLPVFPELEESEIETIIKTIKAFFGREV